MPNLDNIDRQLLTLLQANDQSSLGELGGVVGLAPSSVKERARASMPLNWCPTTWCWSTQEIASPPTCV